MVLQGEEAIIYLYTLNDKNKKFDVEKYEYTKGANNYKKSDNNEDEEEEKKEEEPQEPQEEPHEMKDVESNEQGTS